MSVFLRVTGTSVKQQALHTLIEAANAGTYGPDVFSADSQVFACVPGSPFAYWAPPSLSAVFSTLPRFGRFGRCRVGASTNTDPRFLRCWWETSSSEARWVPHAKGGSYARFYADVFLLVNWQSNAAEIEASQVFKYPYLTNLDWLLHRENDYGWPGACWTRRTSAGLSMRVLPRGVVFGNKGPAARLLGDSPAACFSFIALANSRPYAAALGLQLAAADAAARSYEAGLLDAAPFPSLTSDTGAPLARLAHRAWSLKRSVDTITETSHAFVLPALLQDEGETLAERAAAWAARVAATEAELAAIQREIDDIAFRLYGIDGEDRARIEAESGAAPTAAPADEEAPDGEAEAADEPDDEDDDESTAADTATLATELLSWAVGVAFGRFDLDIATGRRAPPPEPGPFDPLPARSPGMVPDDARAAEVLVDDPGHPEDIVSHVVGVFAAVFGEQHEARLDEAVGLVDAPAGPDAAARLRLWLRRSFFPFHLKRYSKSRRKAPIWWPLSTASGSYTLWVAWPRLTRDTLYRLTSEQEPYVAAKVAQETRKLTGLKQDAGKNPTTAQAKVIGAQEDLVAELTALRDELTMVAPMWNPVHDDGVVLHAALLWRVTRDAGWQKECREKWDGLVAGKYDWAHVAMHLWPERVVPKCREDRSLAIAHGLEERFWVEIAGKWRLRDATGQAMNEEITTRTSAAVKKALRAMQEAPAPVRGRRSKRQG